MTDVGVYEAKTHLPRLLEAVQRGESITITRHGRPVARLVPIIPPEPDVEQTLADLLGLRRGHRLDGLSIRDLIDDGRRF